MVAELGAAATADEERRLLLATCRERVLAVGGAWEEGFGEEGVFTKAVLPVAEDDPGSPSGDSAPIYDRRDLVRVAISRALAVPLFLALIAVAEYPVDLELALVIAAGSAYVAGTLVWALRGRITSTRVGLMVAMDLVVIGSVMAASGGPQSQMTVIFFIWPISMSLLYGPLRTFGCLLASIVVFAAVSLPFVVPEGFDLDNPDVRALALAELSLLWVGTITVAAADAFHRRAGRIASLSAVRQRILADALEAEERARRRLSLALHDDALQVLLAAGQDIDEGIRGSAEATGRAREELRLAIARLRDIARGLDPASAAHGGLATGLDELAERAGRLGGFTVDVRVDPAAAGIEDDLILTLARELSINAAKHSQAENLRVQVARADGRIELDVADDGRGIRVSRLDAALADGHIGLPSCIERVEAAGGTLEIETPPEGGSRISVRLPAGPRAT
jgi:signal transduction histidine kinase